MSRPIYPPLIISPKENTVIWAENPSFIERFFKCFVGNPKAYINLLCVSLWYNNIGQEILKTCESMCKCKCAKMKQFKIHDTVKRWKCMGCEYRIELNSWEWKDWLYRDEIRRNVCEDCYKDHWLKIMYRPLGDCIDVKKIKGKFDFKTFYPPTI